MDILNFFLLVGFVVRQLSELFGLFPPSSPKPFLLSFAVAYAPCRKAILTIVDPLGFLIGTGKSGKM